jgi:hypothetical protein
LAPNRIAPARSCTSVVKAASMSASVEAIKTVSLADLFCRCLRIANLRLVCRLVAVCQEPDRIRLWRQFSQQAKLFRCQRTVEIGCAGDIASRAVQTGHQPELHGIVANRKDNRDRRGRSLRCRRRSRAATRHKQVHTTPDEIPSQGGEAIELAPSKTKFDREILALDVTCFPQPPAQFGQQWAVEFGCSQAEEANHRNRRPLRMRGERACRHRSTKQRDEITPSHRLPEARGPRPILPLSKQRTATGEMGQRAKAATIVTAPVANPRHHHRPSRARRSPAAAPASAGRRLRAPACPTTRA